MIRPLRRRGVRERDLVSLADGSLRRPRRAEVERAIARSADLRADIAAQRRALQAIEASDERAPASLRARVRAEPRAVPHAGWRPMLPRLALVLLVALTVLAGGLAIRGSVGGPTVAQAAALALRPAQAPAPEPVSDRVAILPDISSAGLPYPYWEDRFGYVAAGVRRDQLAGRLATTVFYRHDGRQIAYTIVAGRALSLDLTATVRIDHRTRLSIAHLDGRVIVSWLRRGHTCVLSARGVPVAQLRLLAAWSGGGRVPF